MFTLITKHWKFVIIGFVGLDLLVVGGLLYFFVFSETEQASSAKLARVLDTPSPTPTATLWPGPGRRITPTPPLLPTPMSTDVLAESGFPPGFTPTPMPTREVVLIKLPHILPNHRSRIDSPEINQIYYPEPFFPAGSNNACGPVALFAALQGLGADVPYAHLRNIAVNNGFTSYGITKGGMFHTISTINRELNNPYTIAQGNNYRISDVMKNLRQGGVVIVLLRARRENGEFRVTADTSNSFGHFLIVESINLRTKSVRFAGSTLGMDKVPLQEFLESWGSNPQALSNSSMSLQNFLKNEKTLNWALVIKKNE